jgi:exosortase A-associated hydrolase 1
MLQAIEEMPFFFRCEGEQLLGIVAAPPRPIPTGVLIIVGGPQYRVGSHRQFVHLSRWLAERSIACMRFDYRGMGDSGGAMRTFEHIDSDIRAAVDAFFTNCPQIRSVTLWGLCDGASAVCFYAATDPRISSIVLVNPWIRTEQSLARVHLRHYYVQRLLSRAFWHKLFHGDMSARTALISFFATLRLVVRPAQEAALSSAQAAEGNLALPERVAHALARFGGKALVILSGNDYTAREFSAACSNSKAWVRALRHARTEILEGADHTFSGRAWKERVAEVTAAWIHSQC